MHLAVKPSSRLLAVTQPSLFVSFRMKRQSDGTSRFPYSIGQSIQELITGKTIGSRRGPVRGTYGHIAGRIRYTRTKFHRLNNTCKDPDDGSAKKVGSHPRWAVD